MSDKYRVCPECGCNEEITLQSLKNMKPQTMFAKGELDDDRLFYMPVKWVAIRGGIWDWAIYYHTDDKPFDWIAKHGDKIHDTEIVERCVRVDAEALKMYRH